MLDSHDTDYPPRELRPFMTDATDDFSPAAQRIGHALRVLTSTSPKAEVRYGYVRFVGLSWAEIAKAAGVDKRTVGRALTYSAENAKTSLAQQWWPTLAVAASGRDGGTSVIWFYTHLEPEQIEESRQFLHRCAKKKRSGAKKKKHRGTR